MLVNVQRYIPPQASCISISIHATLSLVGRLGRGFSGGEGYTPIRAQSPDEIPPGNQVTTREEVQPSLIGRNGWPACSHPGAFPVSLSLLGYSATPRRSILVTRRSQKQLGRDEL